MNFPHLTSAHIPALLARMPKAELHIHIEGSLEPELIFELAQRNGLSLPYANVNALRAAYAFTDLQSFLDIYYAGASVLLQEDDFHAMAMAYFARAAADGVVHAELFFDPQTHTTRGVPFTTVLEGLDASVSVLSVQQGELLFVNRSYRLWFGSDARGHQQRGSQRAGWRRGTARSGTPGIRG